MEGSDISRVDSARASGYNIWRNNSMDVFSTSEREDDEEALKWAAIERLPTYLRIRRSILNNEDGKGREVDIKQLGLTERKFLMERLVKIAEEDNERFLLKLRERMDRTTLFHSTPPLQHKRRNHWDSDSLEEQVTQGEFVPQGRHDILNTAIGRPDHGGRVRATGSGVTISQYYGRMSRASSSSSIAFTKEQLAEIVVTVREQVMKELEEEKKQSLQAWKKELKDAIITDLFNGDKDSALTNFDLNVLGACVSTKESNAEIAVNPSGEVHVGRVTPPMGLYVQSQNCTKQVALAKIHDGPSTIHCVAYADDVVRVSVEQVIDGEAEVPLPTSEIKYVRDVVNTFIAWPLPLVKLVSNEHSGITPDKVANAAELNNDVPKQDPLRELIKTLVDIYDKPVEFVWDLTEFGIPNVNSSLFLTYTDVSEITSGDKCLNIAILQLWTMYMNEWSNGLGYRSVYGFLEPQSTHNAKDRHGQCEEYIEKWLKESQRQLYIGAYLNDAHWQMVVLCPKDNVVVWFCSVRRRPDVHIKTAINNAYKKLNTTADGKVPKIGPQWLELKTHVQHRGYECGYYVMHEMWNIIGVELKSD
eukprot:XP_006601629.2 uncharacterized protein LOC102661451 [Glycine max]